MWFNERLLLYISPVFLFSILFLLFISNLCYDIFSLCIMDVFIFIVSFDKTRILTALKKYKYEADVFFLILINLFI